MTPERYRAVGLDVPRLLELLAEAKPEGSLALKDADALLALPLPDGGYGRFRLVESPIMAPELAAKFPELKTYLGHGVDDPTATTRLDWTPAGFHAQILSERGSVYVDPAFRDDATIYVCYARRDLGRGGFTCLVPEEEMGHGLLGSVPGIARASGATLRTYRLACAATGEYTAFHGGTVAGGLAAIVTAINRINGIYEREVAIRLVLVANNNLIVYTSAASDPYSNNSGFTMLGQNQSNLDTVIGSANYDIGHVFGTGDLGVASLGSVCSPTSKARGVTGSPSPTGDAFWVDYVAHEMGHQFGANHTFNSTTGGCSGNRNGGTAYEPGSGSTIMAYAGLCGGDNLQSFSDAYFHAGSFDEIVVFTTLGGGNACPTASATGNSPPTVSAGPARWIPINTPFTLTATGSDANGDVLSYCWEEMDLGPATTLSAADNGSSPLFRSFSPTTSPSRTFPRWSDILGNRTTAGERLPTTSRTLRFRVTARDNRAGGGGVNTADTTVTAVPAAGPFVVTSPNTAGTRSGFIPVTWNVAGTASSPINASTVNILLSINGGSTFPFLLATNTPNDGSETVLLPNVTTTAARIMVAAANNIFFDVSNTNFTIVPATPSVNVVFDGATIQAESCGTGNGSVDPGETVTMGFALRNTGTVATTNLVVTLLETNGVALASGPQSYGVLAGGGAAVSRSFSFTADGPCNSTITARLQLRDGAADLGTLTVPISVGGPGTVSAAFTNAAIIAIPGSGTAAGPASPYPSVLNVSGMTGAVGQVTATLRLLSHTFPDDLDVLLVGPGGQHVMLMSDVGGGDDVNNITLTFSDAAIQSLPDSGLLTSGTWLPTNIGASDPFNAPAPFGPYGSALTVFNGTNPNGAWSLFIMDDANGDIGSLSQGWSLNVTTTNPACCFSSADLVLGGGADAGAINLGGSTTLVFAVTNLGPAAALGVSLDAPVPEGLSLQSAAASQGSVATVGETVTASFGPLPPGGVATLSLVVTGETPGLWTSLPLATSTTDDPVPGNNALSVPVRVNAPPTISPLSDLTVAQGQPVPVVLFTVEDLDTPADDLVVSGLSSNPALVPASGLAFDLSGDVRTLTITPVPDTAGSALLTVTVSDGLAEASGSFTFTILPAPALGTPVMEEGGVRLTWSAVPGQTYRVRYKDDLADPSWTPLRDDLKADADSLSVLDPEPAAAQRFYQVMLVP